MKPLVKNSTVSQIVGLCVVLFFGAEDIQATTADGPNLQFEQLTYHFGFAGQNREVVHEFRFKNTGMSDLLIEVIKANCACQITAPASKTFSPGQSNSITVTCKTGREIGQLSETITVFSNDPDQPEIPLKVVGMVRADYALDPEFLNFGEVERSLFPVKTIRFIDVADGTLELKRVQASEEYLYTHTSVLKDDPLKGYLIQVTVNPDAPAGPFFEPITLHTNLKRRPRIDIPVTGHVLGPIRARPSVLRLGRLEPGQTLESDKRLKITSAFDRSFKIMRLDVKPPVLQAEPGTGTAKEHEISLRVPVDAQVGPFDGQIEIVTDHPEQSCARVRIMGLIAEKGLPKPVAPVALSPVQVKTTEYVTRVPTEEDTYVAAWLIKRFIDPTATFSFVKLGTPLPEEGVLFDLPSSQIRWRRTHNRCTSENVLVDMKEANSVHKKIVIYMARLERASWLVSPNSDAGRLRVWIQRINATIDDPHLRVRKAFAYFDKIYAAGGSVPE